MARLLIGLDSTGTACIKIMKNNSDNPYSTPDSSYGKFSFNSKKDQVRFVGSDQLNYGGGTVAQFLPSGTNKNNFQRARIGYDTGVVSCYWKNNYWNSIGDLDYDLPVFDIKRVNSSGRYDQTKIGSSEASSGTLYSSACSLDDGYVIGFKPGAGNEININMPAAICTYAMSGSNPKPFVWNLPGDETDIINPPLTPVPGQKTIQITKDFCRVAKPGYNVTTAIASQLAFDSSSRPAKIIAAADIAIPGGTTTYDFSDKLTGINVSGEFVADVIQYKGSTIVFPASLPDDEDDYGATYYFDGQTLVFTNGGSSIRARFLIYAQDDTSPSSGSNKVFRQITISGDPVFQFLRPGAASTPRLADVIIDSRWPVLQIIKTDWFTIPTGNDATTDISFTSSGLFPFIKYFTIHPAGQPNSTLAGSTDATANGKRIRQPFVMAGFVRNPGGAKVSYVSGACTWCQLGTNLLRFHTYRGNLYRRGYNSDGDTVNTDVFCEATRIRYYIFGIPA